MIKIDCFIVPFFIAQLLRSGFANIECRDVVSFSNLGGQTVIQWPKFGGAMAAPAPPGTIGIGMRN